MVLTQTVLIILCLAGYWEFFGRSFKTAFCILVEVLLVSELVWKSGIGAVHKPSVLPVMILSLAELILIYQLIKILLVIYRKDKDAFEIEFPFNRGKYLVTDGGNSRTSRLMNYHYYSPVHMKKGTAGSMLYATDIAKISTGKIKFMPRTNEEYSVFNEKIYAPMEGTILKVENSIDDNIPFSGNYPYTTGNTVVIKKDHYYFLLGHMKKNSICVKEGDAVKKGDLLGSAGNSGMSERPHLHMQMMYSEDDNFWKGRGVNIIYKGKNLFKNRVI